MGEWIGASIRFGGKIGADLVPELVDLIKAHGLSVDFEGDDPDPANLHETFGDWQINYGCLDELEAFAARHGLDYEYWFDRGPDWSAATVRYVGGERVELADGGGGPCLTEGELRELGYDGAMARFAQFKSPLPPLEIVGFTPSPGSAEGEGERAGVTV